MPRAHDLLIGAALAASIALAGPACADPAARAAIADHCERCHPPLPDGGWEVMTARPLDAAELAVLLRRMAEEYSAFPAPEERAAIIAFLARPEGG